MIKLEISDLDSKEKYLATMRENYVDELIGCGWDEERAKLFTKSIGGKCFVMDVREDQRHKDWIEIYTTDLTLDFITIYVFPEYRRKGLCKRVLEATVELYGHNRLVQTFVNESNVASIKMHEKLGFKQSGRTYLYDRHLVGIQ